MLVIRQHCGILSLNFKTDHPSRAITIKLRLGSDARLSQPAAQASLAAADNRASRRPIQLQALSRILMPFVSARLLSLFRSCLAASCAALALVACNPQPQQDWRLTNIQGHLPDLEFNMMSDRGTPVTARDFKGHVGIVFFGYTHCPDVCPTTLAKLTEVLGKLGPEADRVKVLFISVDPRRDDPRSMHAYVDAFDARHVVGLSGSDKEVEQLAKRYRVAYQVAHVEPDGNYEVTHSAAVYFFDGDGHARLIATADDSAEKMVHDVRLLLSPDTVRGS